MIDWRAHLKIHPAAERFPQLSEAELKELVCDIEANGLQVPVVIWTSPDPDDRYEALIDGRNRLDALAMLGRLSVHTDGYLLVDGKRLPQRYATDDPFKLAIALNIRRRHLNIEQRGEIVIQLLARQPNISDRQLGKELGVDHKTIAKARAKGEDVGRIPHVEKRTDSRGRRQPATKPRKAGKTFRRKLIEEAAARTDIKNPERLPNKVLMDAIAERNLATTPDLVDQCVENVSEIVERAVGELRRGHAPQEKFAHLFAALGDAIADLERKTLPPTGDAATLEANESA
jgi:ParB-like chromosome segregation protein Spo0J